MSYHHDNIALDNPVWSSLTTRHAHVAQGDRFALRYPPGFSPLSGLPAAASDNLEALQSLVEVGDAVAVAGAHVPEWPANWETLHRIRIVQMVRRDASPLPEGGTEGGAEGGSEIAVLTAADVGDMLALVELTHPGPFRERTIELGKFVGIRQHGQLLAMAGERMWVGDHREVSAVCTHPDAQGRGFARALMGRVINRMLRAGQIPFLHVESINERAIAMYKGLGFTRRVELPLLYAKRTR
jgi:ribosomal protein S18 acetylase RimI-like enzyme